MGIPPAHLRVTYSGVFASAAAPTEIWSMNMCLGEASQPFAVGSDLTALANAVATPFVTRLLQHVRNEAELTNVRVASVDNTGHVAKDVTGAYIQRDSPVAAFGSGSGVELPYQISLALTMHSTTAGSTGRGRMYLPSPAYTSLSQGVLSDNDRNVIATSFKGFVNDVNTAARALFPSLGVSIASGGSTTQGIAPALRPVTKISVGKVLDTQRRRRSELNESRVLVPLA